MNMSSGNASRSGACQLYCHVDQPASSLHPPAPYRRRCGPDDVPCKDCVASAVVAVIIRGECDLSTAMSQIHAQAARLQALDLYGLQPPLGVAGAATLKDAPPLLLSLLALALDNNGLQSGGMHMLGCEFVKRTQLQALSCMRNDQPFLRLACLV
jgi:hypothetical protein